MSAISRWLYQQLHHPPPVGHDDSPALHFSGFDLATLLDCHSDWLEHLSRNLDDDNDGLPVLLANVMRDDNCALGRWLYSDIKDRFGHTQEYQQLLRHHAEFHRLAGDICRCHNQGLFETARWGLGHDLKILSAQIRQDLETFYHRHLT
jgi:hypothetical protein